MILGLPLPPSIRMTAADGFFESIRMTFMVAPGRGFSSISLASANRPELALQIKTAATRHERKNIFDFFISAILPIFVIKRKDKG
jgi:hypothetical protein